MRTQEQRIRTLLNRINIWEDASDKIIPLAGIKWALEDAEELILDIKQCLESLIRDY